MKTNFDISSIGKALIGFVRRFHTILFFLAVSGGLFVAILMLLSIISQSSNKAQTSSQTVNGTFDEETIRRLKEETADQITPGSRPSPFVE